MAALMRALTTLFRVLFLLTLCAAVGAVPRASALGQPAWRSALACRRPACTVTMRDDGSRGTARRTPSLASSRKFEQLQAQAEREPADRTAGKIVAAGLLVGLGGVIAFAAANGYLSGPTLR